MEPHFACSHKIGRNRTCKTLLAVMQELGAAGLTKRPTSCMLILPKAPKGASEDVAEYTTTYQDVLERVKAVQPLY